MRLLKRCIAIMDPGEQGQPSAQPQANSGPDDALLLEELIEILIRLILGSSNYDGSR